MNKVYKYQISTNHSDIVKIEVPKGSVFLNVKNQKDKLVAYFQCPDTELTESIGFVSFYTGIYLADNPKKYIDTVLFDEGNYVLHVYQLI